jgi:hypothetical protein
MIYDLRTVALEDIRQEEHTYRISTASDDSLQGSIGRAGLIHPPKLLQTADGIIVLAGFRRLAACRALGWPRVPAHVFEEQDISASERCILAIADNTVNRQLNLVETAAAVRLLHDRLENADAVSRALRALQMPTNTAWIDQQMAMSSLPGFLHEALLAGVIGEAMAQRLGKVDREDAAALCRVFTDYRFNLNRQREVLTLCVDISRRDDRTIREVLMPAAAAAEAGSASPETAQRRRALLEVLHRGRYPRIAGAERRFEQLRKALGTGEGMQLTPPAYFEGRAYRMTFSFSSIPEFHERIARLRKIADNPHLDAILSRESE